ncbi:MAG: hypothetical protein M0Q91_12150 [Methanoregula sp.]|jgi:hypothetical protein|nr:hypothetical protein [Methanoregula sp.]
MSDNKEWLDSLKVGDDVAIDRYQYGKRTYSVRKIDKITPTRRFSINGAYYDKNGREMGSASSWGIRSEIVPVTDEIKTTIRRSNTLFAIGKFPFDSLNNGDLESIYNIIKNKIEEEG